jgi:site-specific DNA recombinase
MEMFDDIKTGKIKVKKVYVYMFNRFMRNPDESRFYKMRLEALGVDVVSAMQTRPEEAYMANFMEGIIELTDKMTSDIIGIHVRSGMEELARRGYWTGGPPPFGYAIKQIDSREGHLVKGEIVKRAILVPNEEQAAIVRRIFEIAATADVGGHRIYEILCQELGREILGSKGQKLGGRGVNAILRKPIYKGRAGLFSESFLQGLVDEIINPKQQQAGKTDRAALERRLQELSA